MLVDDWHLAEKLLTRSTWQVVTVVAPAGISQRIAIDVFGAVTTSVNFPVSYLLCGKDHDDLADMHEPL